MPTEDELIADIKNVKIQGATNIALAIIDFLVQHPDKDTATRLANVRPNEPLAQNAVKFIFAGGSVPERITQYKALLSEASAKLNEVGRNAIKDGNTYLTHCHASSVTNALVAHKNCKVFTTETRPLFQGRTTARELMDAGLDVTHIVDSAAAAVLTTQQVTAVLVGADLLGDNAFVNKIGTLPVVLAATAMHLPIFVFATLLKYDPRPLTPDRVEMRSGSEIWPEAPQGLKFYAPAFDIIPYHFDVTLVTEAGLIQGSKMKETIAQVYPWLINTKTI